MAEMQCPVAARPQRKRKKISYHDEVIESDVDEEIIDNESDGDEFSLEAPATRAKRAIALAKTKAKNKPPPSAKKEKTFDFLGLPTELRNIIYELALVELDGIELINYSKSYRRTVRRGKSERGSSRVTRNIRVNTYEKVEELSPSFLVVNRQVNSEATIMMYSQPLRFQDTIALHAFLVNIGASNRALLTDITLLCLSRTPSHKALNYPAFCMLSDATGLRRLFIDEKRMGYDPDYMAKSIYRFAHVWLRSYGKAKGKYDAAVEILELHEEAYRPQKTGDDLEGRKADFHQSMRAYMS